MDEEKKVEGTEEVVATPEVTEEAPVAETATPEATEEVAAQYLS